MRVTLAFVMVFGLMGCGMKTPEGQQAHTQNRAYTGGSISVCTTNVPKSKQYFSTPVPNYYINTQLVGRIMMVSESLKFRGQKALGLKVDLGDTFEVKAPKDPWSAQFEDIVYFKLDITNKKDRYIIVTPKSNFAGALGKFVLQSGSAVASAIVGGVEGSTEAKNGTPYLVEAVTKNSFSKRCS